MIKKIILLLLPFVDLLISPLVIISSFIMKFVRLAGVQRMKISKYLFEKIGVFPIIDHYYEPIFNEKKLSKKLSFDRKLPGIDWNEDVQIDILSKFSFTNEFDDWNKESKRFFFGNGSFESGDAEYLYNFVRFFKPKQVIEIGCGFSSLIVQEALKKNKETQKDTTFHQTCIEPYEVNWLEKTGINVLRKRVEEVDRNVFRELNEGDLLFIDSSHIIRPQGDIVYEYLEILPILQKGVFVHIHDIFTPQDYPKEWVFNQVKLWNEQYLVEAFLCNNEEWEIIGSLNLLHNKYFSKFNAISNYHSKTREPGSIYIRKKK